MVKWISSSTPISMPLMRDEQLTVANILNSMELGPEQREHYTQLSHHHNFYNLDKEIKEIVGKKSKPLVHAEVLLHARLRPLQERYDRLYWNNWRYIGSSKATCRLCTFYFDNQTDGVKVRTGHHNLYVAWRLPDLPALEKEIEAREQREQRLRLIAYITERVGANLLQTLSTRRTVGRRYDTNTYTFSVRGPRGNPSDDSQSVVGSAPGSQAPPPYQERSGSDYENVESDGSDNGSVDATDGGTDDGTYYGTDGGSDDDGDFEDDGYVDFDVGGV